MELKNTEILYSSDKCEILLCESTDGKLYTRKNRALNQDTAALLKHINSPFTAHLAEYDDNSATFEYVEGTPLNETKLSTDKIYSVFCELCDGLSALHKVGIIHRDIKPSNIILANDGHIKIIDFDAARVKKPTADKDTMFIGTDGFAPPEQFGFCQTDERSDIYALGITMQLLLGDGYQRSSYRHIIEKCMRFNPEQRYSSVASVKRSLQLRRFAPTVIGVAAALCLITAVIITMVFATSNTTDDSLSSVKDNGSSVVDSTSQGTTTPPTSVSTSTTAATTNDTTTTASTTPAPTSSVATTLASTTIRSETTMSTAAVTTTTQSDIEYEKSPVATINGEYPWDILLLPEEFPHLSDTVSFYNVMDNYIEIRWENTTTEQTKMMAELLYQWKNGDFTSGTSSTSDYWYIKEPDSYEIMLSCIHDEYSNESETLLCYRFNSYREKLAFPAELGTADITIPEESTRSIAWSGLSLPAEIPQLADSVSSFLDQSKEPDTEDTLVFDYIFQWDIMSLREAALAVSGLDDLSDYTCAVTLNDGNAIWQYYGDTFYMDCHAFSDDDFYGKQCWISIVMYE